MDMRRTAYTRTYPALYRGVVESNDDPKGLGRCRVRVPSVHGKLSYPIDVLPWARPIVLSPVKSGRGSVNMPDVGDVVWVMFEGASKDYPVYFGGTYAIDEVEVNPNRVDFYIEEDTKISYDRLEGYYVINIKGNEFQITKDSIYLSGNLNVSGDLNILGDLRVEGTASIHKLVLDTE